MKKIIAILLLFNLLILVGCDSSISKNDVIVEKNLVQEGEGEKFRSSLIQEDGSIDKEFLHKEIQACSKVGITMDYIEEILKGVKSSEDTYMQMAYFADSDGNFYCSEDIEMPSGYDPRERSWYTSAIEEGIYISDIYVDFASGDKIISFATKIDSENIEGVLGYDYIVEKATDTE
jgi:hypothetical protein